MIHYNLLSICILDYIYKNEEAIAKEVSRELETEHSIKEGTVNSCLNKLRREGLVDNLPKLPGNGGVPLIVTMEGIKLLNFVRRIVSNGEDYI